jgi:hypothetical protein
MCQAEREHRLGEEYIEHELLRATLADSVDASSAGDVERWKSGRDLSRVHLWRPWPRSGTTRTPSLMP